jgi:hypothetical protein
MIAVVIAHAVRIHDDTLSRLGQIDGKFRIETGLAPLLARIGEFFAATLSESVAAFVSGFDSNEGPNLRRWAACR